MKIINNIPFSETVDSVNRQCLAGSPWPMMLLHKHGMIQDTPAFSHVGKIKALKGYVQARLWIGTADLTSTERQRKDSSVAAHILNAAIILNKGSVRVCCPAAQLRLTSLCDASRSVLLRFLFSSYRLRSAEDSWPIVIHYCAIRVKCDTFHHLSFYSFVQNIYR